MPAFFSFLFVAFHLFSTILNIIHSEKDGKKDNTGEDDKY